MIDTNLLKTKIETLIFKYSDDLDKKEEVSQLKVLLDRISKFEKEQSLIKNKNDLFSKIKNKLYKIFNNSKVKKEQENINSILEETINLYQESFFKSRLDAARYFRANTTIYDYIKNAITSTIIFEERIVKKNNGNLKLYPIEEKNIGNEEYNNELHEICTKLFTTKKTENEIASESYIKYKTKAESLRKNVMENNLAPYYGTPKFMCNRSNYILKCIQDIISNDDIDEDYKQGSLTIYKKIKDHITNLNEKVNVIEKYGFDQKEEYIKLYDEIEKDYLYVLNIENTIVKDLKGLWNEFLTNPKDYKEGERFAYLVHICDNEIIDPNNLLKVNCTLITDKCMPIPNKKMCLICNPNIEQISGICIDEASSWVIDKAYFVKKDMPIAWQFAESADLSDRKIFYENPEISKLVLPSNIEKEMINENLSFNGEILKYSKKRFFSEIFLKKNIDKIEVPAVLYTEGYYNKKLENVIDDKNFNPIELKININNLRVQNGLKPLDNSIEK